MADQSIFNENQNLQETPAQPGGNGTPPNGSSDDALLTMLSGIKNERGEPKYKTLQDAIVALQNSQEYIPNLKQQLQERDRELEDARRQLSRVDELEKSIEALTRNPSPSATPAGNGLDEGKIADLVQTTLNKREQEKARELNAKEVATRLRDKFGADAERMYGQQAEELGLTVAELNDLAMRTPKAVLKMFGVVGAQGNPGNGAPPNPSIRSDGSSPANQSFISRNTSPTSVGATTQDLMNEFANARKMAEELEQKGRSVSDLSDPKVYKQFFQK